MSRSSQSSMKPSEAASQSEGGSLSQKPPSPAKAPQFGRRANPSDTGAKLGPLLHAMVGLSSLSPSPPPPSSSPSEDVRARDVPILADGEDDQTHREEQRRAREARENFARKVLEMPTNYQSPMPSLKDLDIHCNWDRLLQTIHSEFDMSCLTTGLSRELDEDLTWNPEMLLVQLSSDMRDAAEVRPTEEAVVVPAEAHEVGLISGGEVVRRRREREIPGKWEGETVPLPEKGKTNGGAEGLLFTKTQKRSESVNTKASESSTQDNGKTPISGRNRKSSKSSMGKSKAVA
ncbi:unnamed protein product [Phytomonas sp. Hart1]|nr:unnamed protein product [Phytomonas sp. Hart1]|eukprot:CCW70490.1 unnamed protein product [Phytomonas sp. isolate Hart1]